jgi:polyribonucleotide nucleotidyltransferase
MMVEAGGSEKAWEYYETGAPKVTEEVIADGLEACKTWIKESIALQRQLVEQAGVHEATPFEPVLDYGAGRLREGERGRHPAAWRRPSPSPPRPDRNEATDAAAAAAVEVLAGHPGRARRVRRPRAGESRKRCARSRRSSCASGSWTKACASTGRGPKDLRPRVGRGGRHAHGARLGGLFQRAETQVLNVCTLAMPRMNQLMDDLTPETNKRYLHHYNMAPWPR